MIELTSRTIGPSEIPSSAVEVVGLVLDAPGRRRRRATAAKATLARLSRRTSSMHVLERRDRELDRAPRGQPQLVDPVQVVGIGERDPQRVLVDRVGNRDHPFEHGERDELDRLGRDAGHREVDERQPVALGELPGPVEVVDARRPRRR